MTTYVDPLDQIAHSPAPPAVASVAATVPLSNGGGWQWVVVGLLLGIVLVLGYQRYQRDGFDHNWGDQDRQEEREDGKKLTGKTLIFIHEREGQPIEHDLLLREMPQFCVSHNLTGGFRVLDDDITEFPVPQLLEHAKAKGIESPFVALTDASDKTVRVIAWPQDKSGLEKLVK